MPYVNQPPALRDLFQNLDARINKLETAGRFTSPVVASDLANGRNGDIWLNSTYNAVKYLDNTGTVQALSPSSFLAGKNKVINGDFYWNQRAFTSVTTSQTYTFDRFVTNVSGGTVTYTPQTFTLGSAPVAGYEAVNFWRCAVTGQSTSTDLALFMHRIESARTFANQTVTFTFWAKALSGTPKISAEITQLFGTGGTPSAQVNTYFGQATLSTSWTRYSFTGTVPSVSGLTFGTNGDDYLSPRIWMSAGSSFNSRTGSLGIQSGTFDTWGWQLEAGSVATPFTTASNTTQGELALCQRYYFREGGDSAYQLLGWGTGQGTTTATIQVPAPVQMRAIPTVLDFSNLGLFTNPGTLLAAVTSATIDTNTSSKVGPTITATVASGLTSGSRYHLAANNSTAAYIGFGAEL